MSKTKHYFGTDAISPPSELRIVQYNEDPGYYLIYFDGDGEELTDTYHDTLIEAVDQAEWEFGVQRNEWRALGLCVQ